MLQFCRDFWAGRGLLPSAGQVFQRCKVWYITKTHTAHVVSQPRRKNINTNGDRRTEPCLCPHLPPQACKRHDWGYQIRKKSQFWLWKTEGAVQAAAGWRGGTCVSCYFFPLICYVNLTSLLFIILPHINTIWFLRFVGFFSYSFDTMQVKQLVSFKGDHFSLPEADLFMRMLVKVPRWAACDITIFGIPCVKHQRWFNSDGNVVSV